MKEYQYTNENDKINHQAHLDKKHKRQYEKKKRAKQARKKQRK